MKWRLLVIALLCIAHLSIEQARAQSMNDTFSNNGFLDPRIWSTLSPPPTSTVTVSVTNQQLQVGMGPGIGGGGVISNCSLSGDFDVQVDYGLLNWPTNNNHSARLGAYDLGGVGVLTYSALSPSPELYELGPGSTAHTATADRSGQFRLVRTGSTLSGFFRMGGSWILVGSETVSTTPTRINLDLGTNGTFAIGGIVVAFDNFQVNVGTISCPGLGQSAAAQAKTLLNRPYFLGAKGYDYGSAPNHYVDASTISSGYTHCNGLPGCPGFTSEPGIDCAGLVLWSYNTAAGATTQYLGNNPIKYEGAGAQCSDLQSSSLNVSSLSDLQSGDLLCFRYHYSDGSTDGHIGMYVGEGGVVEAYLPGVGVIPSSLVPDALGHTRANFDPQANWPVCTPTRATRCFDFLGYRRPISAQVGITFATHSPVSLVVTDPAGFTISPTTSTVTHRESLREVPGQLYYVEDSERDDTVIAPVLKRGDYLVKVLPKPSATPTDFYTLTAQTAGGTVVLAQDALIHDIPPNGYGISSNEGSVTPFIPVVIEVNPRKKRRERTDLDSDRRTVTVAILSDKTFNASLNVERSSLTFGRTGDEQSLAFCRPHPEDINDDDRPDLLCHFYLEKTGFEIGDNIAILRGRTLDGHLIRGASEVRIVP